jgi:hypothetical protein
MRDFDQRTFLRRALLTTTIALVLMPATAPAGGNTVAAVCTTRGPDPFQMRLVPTAHANGAAGDVVLRFADSPFGVAVTGEGHHLYQATIRTSRLPRDTGALVVWAASPELDQVVRLGAIGEDGTLSGTIALNKFLVFITAEASADVERWAGPILLRGISPSGRMHTMAGHGPFADESCAAWGFDGRGGREQQ